MAIKCSKCEKEFENNRALVAHERFHCKGAAEDVSKAAKGIKEKQKLCDCPDGGNWRFLNAKNPRHAQAMRQGYKKYCTDCEEVI